MQEVTNIPELVTRKADSHKGDFGKVCIIGGSLGMSGAAALMGMAALKSGAGLVRLGVAKSILPVVAAIDPCYTTFPLAEDKDGRISARAMNTILNVIPDNDVVAVGPGLGVSKDLQKIMECLINQQGLKIVIDADGLNNLSKISNWPDLLKAEAVLTPHPGEMMRLWKQLFREGLPEDRRVQAEMLAQRTGTVVVLKGAATVVCDGKSIYVNNTGNPGMATSGTGDVLTGVISALIGQGMDNFDAAVLGVYLHGKAGDISADKLGPISMTAKDVMENLSNAFSNL